MAIAHNPLRVALSASHQPIFASVRRWATFSTLFAIAVDLIRHVDLSVLMVNLCRGEASSHCGLESINNTGLSFHCCHLTGANVLLVSILSLGGCEAVHYRLWPCIACRYMVYPRLVFAEWL